MAKQLKPTDGKETNAQKYTYEELNEICGRMFTERKSMIAQLQQMSQIIASKRMECLLKIVEMSDKFNDAEFITTCIEEIKESMFAPKESKEESQEE